MSFSADLLLSMDFYEQEYEQFQWDVHILIEGTLHAGLRYLETEAKLELTKIEATMQKPLDNEYHQYLVDEHVDVLATNDGQERFLRNMALVALSSRLTHVLRKMARSAETFSPQKSKYGNPGMSEYQRLWTEYKARFGIDFFSEHKNHVAFVEPMREVRNQIVHDGGEPNTFKPLRTIDQNRGGASLLDTTFSDKYPEYVSGNSISAEVSVSKQQLDEHMRASIDLVGWLARELRTRELASLRETNSTH